MCHNKKVSIIPLPDPLVLVTDFVLNTEETGEGFSTLRLLISASTFWFWLNLDGKLEKEGPS